MFWGFFPKINTRLFSLNNDDGNVFILNAFNLKQLTAVGGRETDLV